MKKVLFAVAAFATIALASCGSEKKASESAALDSDTVTVVEEDVVGIESISPDSVAVVEGEAVGVDVQTPVSKEAVKAAASKLTK